jgi:hypothetical protein
VKVAAGHRSRQQQSGGAGDADLALNGVALGGKDLMNTCGAPVVRKAAATAVAVAVEAGPVSSSSSSTEGKGGQPVAAVKAGQQRIGAAYGARACPA